MSQATHTVTTTQEAAVCATCAQPLHGPYCSQCGEKKLDRHDRRVSHIFEELIHSLTHADSNFLRSLKYLLTRPGFLTSEYLAGRRKRYTSPLSLFFIANLLYLLCGPIDAFNSSYVSMMGGQPYSETLIVPQMQHKMQQKQWTPEAMADHYNEKSTHEAKLLLILYIFILSLPVALLYISRRRYYYDYIVFAMEYVNFIMYGLMLLLPWVVMVVVGAVQLMQGEKTIHINVMSPVAIWSVILLLWLYLAVATRRVFQQAWWLTIIKAAALVVGTIVAMFAYRYLAFQVIMFLL